jgi:hypothetical protein
MAEPAPDELEIRLHRLYPHATVRAGADGWVVARDAAPEPAGDPWWADPALPAVTYGDRGLILEANDAAVDLLGSPLAGRHWQELVTPGTSVEVDEVIALIMERGSAVSRFRMPGRDGAFVEFDSFTEVIDGGLRTVMRPRPAGSGR